MDEINSQTRTETWKMEVQLQAKLQENKLSMKPVKDKDVKRQPPEREQQNIEYNNRIWVYCIVYAVSFSTLL